MRRHWNPIEIKWKDILVFFGEIKTPNSTVQLRCAKKTIITWSWRYFIVNVDGVFGGVFSIQWFNLVVIA